MHITLCLQISPFVPSDIRVFCNFNWFELCNLLAKHGEKRKIHLTRKYSNPHKGSMWHWIYWLDLKSEICITTCKYKNKKKRRIVCFSHSLSSIRVNSSRDQSYFSHSNNEKLNFLTKGNCLRLICNLSITYD